MAASSVLGRVVLGRAGKRTAEQTAAALQQALSLIQGLERTAIVAYTDGACLGNPGHGGSAARIEYPHPMTLPSVLKIPSRYTPQPSPLAHICEFSRYEGELVTNNYCELCAIRLIVEQPQWRDRYITKCYSSLNILTDSQYCITVIEGNSLPNANAELVLTLRRMVRSSLLPIRLHKVCGHIGLLGNERVDQLAGAAAQKK